MFVECPEAVNRPADKDAAEEGPAAVDGNDEKGDPYRIAYSLQVEDAKVLKEERELCEGEREAVGYVAGIHALN